MKHSKNVVIFGTGEIGELAHFYFKNDSDFRVVAFSADDEFIKESTFQGLPVVPLSELPRRFPASDYSAHVALSYLKLNQLRERKYFQFRELGYNLVSYVCSRSVTWPDLAIGDNCFVLENQTIQPKVKIGNNVMIWSGNHLGHGCQIRDHVYLASHICISGYTVIGERSFVGVNATFRDYIEVGPDSFIAMDASVVKSVPAGSVVLGASGTVMSPEDPVATKIKNRYFKF